MSKLDKEVKDLIREIIGEDEKPLKDYNPNNRDKLTIADRNKLRAELRQKLEEL